ncbi:hypothetical protein RRH01S_18_00600 [Rhizobium rhizogenes NBRC 13257]|uniref:Uncharacterized protein n=1 Tax=Rhizobium rhizogenes NBRC 13257 TaxID=1220581 RepID=A0AA87QFA9_RHIRH|nr:hypothetical protein RRH01S_18_00600 [Rhizobium rhizogenes NBRC 13257]
MHAPRRRQNVVAASEFTESSSPSSVTDVTSPPQGGRLVTCGTLSPQTDVESAEIEADRLKESGRHPPNNLPPCEGDVTK